MFSAGPGWDATTGWGGIDGAAFLGAYANTSVRDFNYTGPTPGLPTLGLPLTPATPGLTLLLIVAGVVLAVALVALVVWDERVRLDEAPSDGTVTNRRRGRMPRDHPRPMRGSGTPAAGPPVRDCPASAVRAATPGGAPDLEPIRAAGVVRLPVLRGPAPGGTVARAPDAARSEPHYAGPAGLEASSGAGPAASAGDSAPSGFAGTARLAGVTFSFVSRNRRISSGFVEAIPKYSANAFVVHSSSVEPFGSARINPSARRRSTSS